MLHAKLWITKPKTRNSSNNNGKNGKERKNGKRKIFLFHSMTFLKNYSKVKISVFSKNFRYFRCSSFSMNNHHRGTEAVLLERGILVGAGLVAVLQFCDDGVAEDAVALAVDEDDATPFLLDVLVHRFAEHS